MFLLQLRAPLGNLQVPDAAATSVRPKAADLNAWAAAGFVTAWVRAKDTLESMLVVSARSIGDQTMTDRSQSAQLWAGTVRKPLIRDADEKH